MRIAWTIAGSDSGSGAGIQADLKTMNAFGVHGCSVITAVTAQNSIGVDAIESVSPNLLREQLRVLKLDLSPAAIKLGMLGTASSCEIIAEFLDQFQNLPLLICDPILTSTSGATLLDSEALDMLIHGIFPNVDILTPNLPETTVLIGQEIHSIEAAAEQILAMGVKSVLIKGGHVQAEECRDYWTNGERSIWLSSPRLETTATHGTGCILSSAVAAAAALGRELPEAVVLAKTFLNQCLRSPAGIGSGCGPMRIDPFRDDPPDRPDVSGYAV